MPKEETLPFRSLYRHGFARVAVGVPTVEVAEPEANAAATITQIEAAEDQGAAVVLFPELGLSAYTCDDLFHQDALLEASSFALEEVVAATDQLEVLVLVGAPLKFWGKLFNCAVAVQGGRVLGVVPKTYLPGYREFYEPRQFCAARHALADEVQLFGETVPFGNDLIFEAQNVPGLAVHAEICEDVWTPVPPSTFAALAGATILTNLSASNITVGKADWRKTLCAGHSGRCVGAYLYAAAGGGESTTDLAWDGHALAYENGALLAESDRFSDEPQLIVTDIDLERLAAERMRLNSFHETATEHGERVAAVRRITFDFGVPAGELPLQRTIPPRPYVPSDTVERDARCYEAYNIQVAGLKKRLKSSGIKKIVIGVSGGLDSTHALIVACRTMDALKLPRENVLAYTMPGFATGDASLGFAHQLMKSLGVSAHELDIKPSSKQMLEDIGHPYSEGEEQYDITFENVQAGERTSHLFRLANHQGGLVLGTGDLSELALGWCTYGVGDHMSHYNVNASVPKTLIQHLIGWVAETGEFGAEASATLKAVLESEITPELVPDTGSGVQSTEEKVGPYPLQDFHLYYITRFGFRPSKVAFLAESAWEGTYELDEIRKWLKVFLWRFFQTSQFKRTCVPNSPKVGSGGSLSPRGDWRAPSDAGAAVWIRELEENVR